MIERVQIDITEQRAHHSALWRALFGRPFPITVEDSLFKETLDQCQDLGVRHFLAYQGHQAVLRDRVEVAFQINIDDDVVPGVEQILHPPQRGLPSPNRGSKDAVRRGQELIHAGYNIIVDVDLKSYFDTIPKDRLMALIRQKVADTQVLALIESFLEQGVLDGDREWTPEQGTPQGAVVSPLLSNIYLDPLDHLMAERGFEMVRYADDFVVMCRTLEEATAALALVKEWTASADLTLHPTKTRLVEERKDGFDFLGYHFEAGKRWPRSKSLQKFRDTIRAKTKRTSG